MKPTLMVACVVLGLPLPLAVHAQGPDSTRLRDRAVLTGVVRDTAGAPLAGADVLIPALQLSHRTEADGTFDLAVQADGTYEVWVRRVGYDAVNFDWPAKIGRELQIAVKMQRQPITLDTVEVRAREEKRVNGTATISGIVVDTAGIPIPEVEVQLYGAKRQVITNGRGRFDFRRLAGTSFQVRARMLGSRPVTVGVQLAEGETREMVIILRQLPPMLDAVVVRERSGYGDESALRDFEKRQLWRGARTATLGPADLQRFGKVGLDWVAQSLRARGVLDATPSQRAVTSINGMQRIHQRGEAIAGSVCILENGTKPLYLPLWQYDANKVATFEVYPSNTEVTKTISSRMNAYRQCEEIDGTHPTYYVIWTKQQEDPAAATRRR